MEPVLGSINLHGIFNNDGTVQDLCVGVFFFFLAERKKHCTDVWNRRRRVNLTRAQDVRVKVSH